MAPTLGKQFGILPKLSLTAQIIGCVLLSAVITGGTLIAARIVNQLAWVAVGPSDALGKLVHRILCVRGHAPARRAHSR